MKKIYLLFFLAYSCKMRSSLQSEDGAQDNDDIIGGLNFADDESPLQESSTSPSRYKITTTGSISKMFKIVAAQNKKLNFSQLTGSFKPLLLPSFPLKINFGHIADHYNIPKAQPLSYKAYQQGSCRLIIYLYGPSVRELSYNKGKLMTEVESLTPDTTISSAVNTPVFLQAQFEIIPYIAKEQLASCRKLLYGRNILLDNLTPKNMRFTFWPKHLDFSYIKVKAITEPPEMKPIVLSWEERAPMPKIVTVLDDMPELKSAVFSLEATQAGVAYLLFNLSL